MAEQRVVSRQHEMILRNSKRSRTGHWVSLPLEIRLLILGVISTQKSPGWGSLASVCKEWQSVIEKENFYRLTLRLSCLEEFQHIAIRQRKLIRYIQFDIELRRYTCRCCQWPESESWLSSNNKIIKDGLFKLFSILSAWEPANTLALELNAYSPSDSEHWFKDSFFISNDQGQNEIESSRPGWHDPIHGWVDGQQISSPPESAIIRLFEMIDLVSPEELPANNAVTCFIIRRQLRRWFLPEILWIIWSKLHRLDSIIYEPWRIWDDWFGETVDQAFVRLVQNHLPDSLKSLTVFEDFSDAFARTLANAQFPMTVHFNMNRIINPEIGKAFAVRSLNLKQLSLSYLVDANDFFKACSKTWTWKHLQCLALTSPILQSTESHLEINTLLSIAGISVLQMPRLHTFALWNGTQGNACAFLYCMDRYSAQLTWRSTWDLELGPGVVKIWDEVALKLHSTSLNLRKEAIRSDPKTHGDAIHLLNLPPACQVVTPASLWQIRKEGQWSL